MFMLGSFILCIVILKLSIGHLYSYMCKLNGPLKVYFIIFFCLGQETKNPLQKSNHFQWDSNYEPLDLHSQATKIPLWIDFIYPLAYDAGNAHVCPINKTAAAKNCYSTCIEWKFPENDRLRSFIIAPKNNTVIQHFRGK